MVVSGMTHISKVMSLKLSTHPKTTQKLVKMLMAWTNPQVSDSDLKFLLGFLKKKILNDK